MKLPKLSVLLSLLFLAGPALRGAAPLEVKVDAAKTGAPAWQFTARGKVDASPVIAGDRVWIADSTGRLFAIKVSDGKPQFEIELGGGFTGSPAIADDRLVIASRRGVVYCLGKQ